MTKPVVFLDFDGVLTSARVHKSIATSISSWSKFDPVAIDFLNKIGDKFSVQFTICSTWRNLFEPIDGQGFDIGREPTSHMLYAAGLKHPVDVLREYMLLDRETYPIKDKMTAILQRVNRNNIKNWIIIDDQADEFSKKYTNIDKKHFVKTCEDNGILYKHMVEIIKKLGDMKNENSTVV